MHEPHVPAVGLADEEVHVEVREIRLGNEIVLVEKLLSGVKLLHPQVLVPDVVGLTEIYTSRILPLPLFRTVKKVH